MLTNPTASITVSNAAISVTATSGQTDTYGDAEGSLTYSVTSGALQGTDSFTGGLGLSNESSAAKGAGTVLSHANGFDVTGSTGTTSGNGTYTVVQNTLAISDGNSGGNYNITYNNANFALTAKALTDSGFAVSGKTYDGGVSATITSNGSLTGGGSTTVGSKNAASETATGSLSLTGAQSGDYSLTAPTANATISKENITIAASNQNQTYGFGSLGTTGFSASSGTIYGSDITGVTLSTNATTSSSGNYNVGTWSITPSAATGSGVANYTISYTNDSGTLNVAAKNLAVTANNESKTAGNADPALTYAYSGLASGDASASFTGSLTQDAGESTGDYAIRQGTLVASGDYTIGTFNNGVFTIDAAAATTAVTLLQNLSQAISSPVMPVEYPGMVINDPSIPIAEEGTPASPGDNLHAPGPPTPFNPGKQIYYGPLIAIDPALIPKLYDTASSENRQ